MSTIGSGLNDYFAHIAVLQQRVLDSQRAQLQQVAAAMTEAVLNDRRIFTFGTGHSHLLAEEGHFRAGGLANVVPMLSSGLMLHEGTLLSSQLERTPGLARLILERYRPTAGEMLFVFSNSGVNQLPVEMAQLAKERGLITVAVCSQAYAQIAPLSKLGQRLLDVTDYAIDNGGQPGDSLIALDGSPWRVGPSSTVIGALIWNALITEVAYHLTLQNVEVPVYASSNLPGAAEHNEALIAKWRPRNPHI
ncbi:MAG: SIS domain-containing protein [Anaerolineae bacterium]